MKIKTWQIQSQVKPKKNNQNLGLMLFCGNCKTGRVFKIDEGIKLLLSRQSGEIIIASVCEKCGRKISVALGWINAKKVGYSYGCFDNKYTKQTVVVKDENGLSELHK